MKIINIFADKLFAFKFDGEAIDEFERAFDLWTSIEYLTDFLRNIQRTYNLAFMN